MTTAPPTATAERDATPLPVLLAFVQTLLLTGRLDPAAVEAARDRLVRSGGELWLDGWPEKVAATAAVVSRAAGHPERVRQLFEGHMDAVAAGEAALVLLPVLLRMYPEVAAELPESLAGLVRAGRLTVSAGAALVVRLEVEEAEARFFHGVGVDGGATGGVADA